MWKLTLLLCGAMFIVLLIGGEDRGQLRPGLAQAEAERAAAPDAEAPAFEPAPVLVTATDRAPTLPPAPPITPPPDEPAASQTEPGEPTTQQPVPPAPDLTQTAATVPATPAEAPSEPAIPFSVGPRPATPEVEPAIAAALPPKESPPPDSGAPPTPVGGQILYVSANSVNVRQDPSTNAPVIGRLPRGEPAAVMWEEGADWLRIEAMNSGLEGYVARRFLSPEQP